MAVAVPVADPVEDAVRLIMEGPGNPEDAPDVPEDASPTRRRGDIVIDVTGGRHRFCDDEDAQRMADAWLAAEADPIHVTSLDLSLNKISDVGAVALIDAIAKRPCRLANIDLDGNDIGDETMTALVDRLFKGDASSVKRVDLSSNRISNTALSSLADSCSNGGNTTLESLLIRNNQVSNEGVLHLCRWLEDPDCPLRALHLSGNTLTEPVLADVAEAMKRNVNLTDLNLNNTMDVVNDIQPLVDGVAEHPNLLVLPLALDGKKREVAAVTAMIKRNKAEIKAQQDVIIQLRRAHAAEVAALKERIKELEARLEGGGGADASSALAAMSNLLASPPKEEPAAE